MARPRSLKSPNAWWHGGVAATTRWMESTLEVVRWENVRKAGRRWGWWGAALGTVLGLIVYAPAAWLAQGVVVMSQGHVLPAESQGTVWNGSAILVLTGGPGSRDARALPGRVSWQLRPNQRGLRLRLQHECCLADPVVVQITPGWDRMSMSVFGQAAAGGVMSAVASLGQWPAAVLTGLGTPWNSLQLGGVVRLRSEGLVARWSQGKLQVDGQLQVLMEDVSSAITTLDRLGSYRIDLRADPQGRVQVNLGTVDGALLLTGRGELSAQGLRFRGEARAAEAERNALENLLNIIGRRMGDRSEISIG